MSITASIGLFAAREMENVVKESVHCTLFYDNERAGKLFCALLLYFFAKRRAFSRSMSVEW